MLATLLGNQPPPLPAVPGRVIVAHDEPLTEAEIDDAIRDGATAAEVALLTGTRRRGATPHPIPATFGP